MADAGLSGEGLSQTKKVNGFLTDLDGRVWFYDTDTQEYMDGYLHDESFDGYDWERKHRTGKMVYGRGFLEEMFDFLIKEHPENATELQTLKDSYIR